MSKTETTNQRNEAQFLVKVYSYILSLPDPHKKNETASPDDLGRNAGEAVQITPTGVEELRDSTTV